MKVDYIAIIVSYGTTSSMIAFYERMNRIDTIYSSIRVLLYLFIDLCIRSRKSSEEKERKKKSLRIIEILTKRKCHVERIQIRSTTRLPYIFSKQLEKREIERWGQKTFDL